MNRILFLSLAFFLFLTSFLICFKVFDLPDTYNFDILTTGGTLATFIIIIWYTNETYLMRITAERNEKNIRRPELVFQLLDSANPNISLVNLSQSIAYNIKFLKIKHNDSMYKIHHENLNDFLKPGDSRSIEVLFESKNLDTPAQICSMNDLIQKLNVFNKNTIFFAVNYQNRDGDKYHSCFRLVKKDIFSNKGIIIELFQNSTGYLTQKEFNKIQSY